MFYRTRKRKRDDSLEIFVFVCMYFFCRANISLQKILIDNNFLPMESVLDLAITNQKLWELSKQFINTTFTFQYALEEKTYY